MVQHPLIDDVVGTVLVVDAAGPVAWLMESLETLLARASRTGRTVVLRTGSETALTPALRHALGAAGAGWAVLDNDGTLRDGRTGVRAESVEDFALRGPELAGSALPQHPAASDTVSQISVDLTLRHRPEHVVDIGSAIEALCAAANCRPTWWGTSEPLAVPWDRWVVTQYARHRAPGVSVSYAVGDGISAAMTAWMRGDAVIETVSAVLTADSARIDDILGAIQSIAEVVVPVFGVVLSRRGHADHLVRAASYGDPVPAAVVVGADATRFLDRERSWPPAGVRVEDFGAGDEDGLVARLDGGWAALEAFLDRIDDERFLGLIGGAPLDPARVDGALDGHADGNGGFGAT